MDKIKPIKLYVCLIMCTLCSVVDACAQIKAGLGARTGVIFSNFTQSEVDFEGNADGWLILSLELGSEKSSLFFMGEASYKGLGAHRITDAPVGQQGRIRTQFDTNYIGFSPMVGIVVFPEKKVSPRFYFGPNIDILTDSKLTFRRQENITGLDIGSDTETVVFGFNVGAGIDFKLGPTALTIDGRFTSAFSNVYKESLLGGALEDVKHEYFGVIVGLHFPFRYNRGS